MSLAPPDSNGIEGRRYGAWVALRADATAKRVSCVCACGAVRQVAIDALESGMSRSCGCTPLSRAEVDATRREIAQRRRLEDWRPQR